MIIPCVVKQNGVTIDLPIYSNTEDLQEWIMIRIYCIQSTGLAVRKKRDKIVQMYVLKVCNGISRSRQDTSIHFVVKLSMNIS